MGSLLQRRQGEDYFLIKPDCQRVPGNPSIFFSVFAIFDGHNGEASGTIFTFVVIDGWTISVASNVEERERVTSSGSEVGRLDIFTANGEALRSRGPKDDTTCVIVDIIPYGYPAIPQTPKKETKSAHFTHSRKEISYVFE
ncbi:putative protein phosphatase 2C family [Helianthus anomalus]